MKVLRYILAAVLLTALAVFVNNTNLLATPSGGAPVLLAHRGIAQQFDRTGLTNETCTAERMLPPTHAFLENTIPSMEASFAAGADIVELDVHPTTDDHFAVFHDWTVDCRTDGHGVTREHTLAELKALDVGYGYTADGGKTYPFRGTGVGLMPSLDEVLARFPDRRFMINVKSNDPAEGEALADALSGLPPERLSNLMAYGGAAPMTALAERLPQIRTLSVAKLKTCLMGYEFTGWTGFAPDACAHMAVFVPINYAPWMWGWPHRFQSRMRAVGSEVFVVGPYNGEGFSTGMDTADDLARLPTGYDGGILTNEIEMVAEMVSSE